MNNCARVNNTINEEIKLLFFLREYHDKFQYNINEICKIIIIQNEIF